MSKFIIIEGTDNTGKDTLQNYIVKNNPGLTFQKLHYTSLQFNDSNIHKQYSSNMYEKMFELLVAVKDLGINLILNRAHLGESVYSPLYRNYSGDYVFNIESNYVDILENHLYLITLSDTVTNLVKRDDNKSLYKNTDQLSIELDSFKRAHNLSNIKNKLFINVSNLSPIEVYEKCSTFLNL